MGRVVAAALCLGCVLSAGCGALARWQRDAIFPRHRTRTSPAVADRQPGLERWWLETRTGNVEAWYLPGKGRNRRHPGPAILYAHGNADVIDDLPAKLGVYRRLGISVLLPEYRGYGRSAGEPNERDILDDFVRFYDRLADRPEVDRQRILFHGRSLGGGVVGALAAKRPPKALILESTFTSLPDLTTRWMVPADLIIVDFDTYEVLKKLSVPVLILHGTRDRVVPFKHARALHRVASQSRLLSYDAGHSDLRRDRRTYWAPIARFLRRARVLRLPQRAGRAHGRHEQAEERAAVRR